MGNLEEGWILQEDPSPLPPEMETLIRESGLDVLTRVTLRARARRTGYTLEQLQEAIASHQRLEENLRQQDKGRTEERL